MQVWTMFQGAPWLLAELLPSMPIQHNTMLAFSKLFISIFHDKIRFNLTKITVIFELVIKFARLYLLDLLAVYTAGIWRLTHRFYN